MAGLPTVGQPDPGGVAVLWRCIVCGAWSHAENRPRSHVRWADSTDVPLDAPVLATDVVDEGDYASGPDIVDRVKVLCGPFERFTAARDTDDRVPPPPRLPAGYVVRDLDAERRAEQRAREAYAADVAAGRGPF